MERRTRERTVGSMSASTHDAPTAEALQLALSRTASPPVEVRESSISWVILTDDRAYRLFKRVRTPGADLRTFEGRVAACDDVVRAGWHVPGAVVRGVRSVVPVGTSFALADRGHRDAVDHVVEMRRYDEGATLAAHAGRGDLAPETLAAVGARVAQLHAEARTVDAGDPVANARSGWHRAVDRSSADAPAPLPPRRLAAIERFADAFVRVQTKELRARAARGMVRDVHGDLRPEHVLLDEPGLPIVGREAHDPSLRLADVGEDLATLLAHLELEGAQEAPRAVLDAYRQAGGDPGSDQLVAFWGARRLLADAPKGDARPFAELAERLTWRARGPVAVVVCGRPPDPRGRLAAMLARRSGWPLLSGDVETGSLTAVPGGVVVEHPLADGASQRAVVGALRAAELQPRILECRTRETVRPSITPDVPVRHRLVVDPEGDLEDLVDEVAVWLDAGLRDVVGRQ